MRSLKVGAALRQSLATTNGLESIFALVEQRTGRSIGGGTATRNGVGGGSATGH